jgi:hypothetical protein
MHKPEVQILNSVRGKIGLELLESLTQNMFDVLCVSYIRFNSC